MGKRQIAAQQTRIKLIQAAKKLIDQKGFDQIKIEDIAKEAGVAKGTFYTYFKKKEDIIDAVSEDRFGQIKLHSDLKLNTAYEKITQFLIKSVEEIEKIGLRSCKLWLGKGVENTDPHYLSGKNKLYFDLNIIEEFLNSENISTDNALSQTILSAYYGSLTLWCMSDGTIYPVEIIKNFCQEYLKNQLENLDQLNKF